MLRLPLVQARNIMLKSSGSEGRGVTAKVADFGLAVKMDHMETHLSNAFQVGAVINTQWIGASSLSLSS